jgi:hypothetical protein
MKTSISRSGPTLLLETRMAPHEEGTPYPLHHGEVLTAISAGLIALLKE